MTLSREDLYSLEQYANIRAEFRTKVLAHKTNRTVRLGPNASLYFEDQLTIQYQVQEMLRIEKIFESGGIDEELETYNPLIPDGDNFKATFMIEFRDETKRRAALAAWLGIEKTVWIKVDALDKVFAISNEDLPRENDHKTSAVHFMRFQLSSQMIEAACQGGVISAGIDLPAYQHQLLNITEPIRESLVADLACH